MTRLVLPAVLYVVLLSLAATPAVAQNYYTDIRPVLVERCVQCHARDGIAWSMEDPDDAFRRRRAIAEMVTDRKMPPWLAEAGHQEYVGDLSLSAETVELIRRWREAGYPEGEPRPDPTPPVHRAEFRPDASVEVLPGGTYLPDQEAPDD